MLNELKKLASNAQKKGRYVVMFVAMEGWQKKGGQGDYVRELSDALARAGDMVLVVGPYYRQPYADISEDEGKYLFDIEIPIGKGCFPLCVYYNEIGGVYYLRFKDRDGVLYPTVYPQIYFTVVLHDGERREIIYPDTLYGYVEAIILSRAGMHILKELGIKPDNLHFNDWQAGLGPVYMEHIYRNDPEFDNTIKLASTVIITHNLAYQGVFGGRLSLPEEDRLIRFLSEKGIVDEKDLNRRDGFVEIQAFQLTNLPSSLSSQTEGGLEFYSNFEAGRHNFLKGGLEFANMIVSVSRGYMLEIQTEEYGYGLDGVIKRRAKDGALTYVYNGVKLDAFNPTTMEELKEVIDEKKGINFNQYSSEDPSLIEKLKNNRKAVYTKLKKMADVDMKKEKSERKVFGRLDEEGIGSSLFVVGVTRLVKQKGYSVLFEPLDEDKGRKIKAGERLIDLMFHLRGPRGEKIQFIVMGTPGDKEGMKIAEELCRAAEIYQERGQMLFLNIFDPKLANQIRATGGIFWIPSLYEPGGIANQQSAKLGLFSFETLTGGLKDFLEHKGTLKIFTAPPFKDLVHQTLQDTAVAFYDGFQDALRLWCRHPRLWEEAVRKIMKFNWDWSKCVPAYEKVYKESRKNIPGTKS
jgi:starch synthase